MTLNPAASPALPVQLSLRDRHAILENVLAVLRKRFYSPEKLAGGWQAAVERHRPFIESASFTAVPAERRAGPHSAQLTWKTRHLLENVGSFRMSTQEEQQRSPALNLGKSFSMSMAVRLPRRNIPYSLWANKRRSNLLTETTSDERLLSM